MSDELNRIPPSRRRRMALVLLPVELALLVAGVLTVSLGGGMVWKVVGCCVVVLAVIQLGVVWGLLRSAALSESALAEQRLDAAIMAASGSTGACDGPAGGCGATDACGSCVYRQALSPRTG